MDTIYNKNTHVCKLQGGLMKSQLIFIEDQSDQAEAYLKHLKLSDEITSIQFIKNLEQTKKLLNTSDGYKRLYWVDINLGKGRHNEGIDIIKTIRSADPDALIVVYSAYPTKKYESIEAGADMFFEKDPATYQQDLSQIKKMFLLEIKEEKEKEESWDRKTTIYSQIVNIDEERDMVLLNCRLENDSNESFMKEFSLRYFENKYNLIVDQSILIHILERPGEIRCLFEKSDEVYFKEVDEIDMCDLEEALIFRVIEINGIEESKRKR